MIYAWSLVQRRLGYRWALDLEYGRLEAAFGGESVVNALLDNAGKISKRQELARELRESSDISDTVAKSELDELENVLGEDLPAAADDDTGEEGGGGEAAVAADDAEDEGAVVEPGASLPVSYCGILKRDGGFTSDDPDERIRQFARVVRATVIVPEHQVISEEEEGEGSEGEGEDLGGAAADERDAAMGRAADAAEEEEEDEGDEPQPTLVETDIIFGGEGPSFRLLLSQPDSSEVEAGGGGAAAYCYDASRTGQGGGAGGGGTAQEGTAGGALGACGASPRSHQRVWEERRCDAHEPPQPLPTRRGHHGEGHAQVLDSHASSGALQRWV